MTILGLSLLIMPFIIKFELENNPLAYDFGSLC